MSFWLFVFKPPLKHAISLVTHGVVFVLMAIDVTLNNYPFRLPQCWVPMLIGLLYPATMMRSTPSAAIRVGPLCDDG